jgi:peptide/nickel transport system permease protein
MRGRSLYLRLGGGVFLLLIAAALLAPIVAPFDPSAVSLADQFATPSWRHPFGADESGRDLLMLLLHGTRVALGVSIPTVALSALIGIGVGAVAGQRGGLIDGLLLRAVDVALAFPGVLLSIFLLFLLGKPSYMGVVLSLSLTGWASFARITRAEVMRQRGMSYAEAARALGLSRSRILLRHLLPNCASALLSQTSFALGSAVLAEAALSFLGIGPYGAPSWGAALDQGASFFLIAPHLAIFPGLAILTAVLGFNFLGDGLRDHLDPQQGFA